MLETVTDGVVDLIGRNWQLLQLAQQIVSWGSYVYAGLMTWGGWRAIRLAGKYAVIPASCFVWAGTVGVILEAKRQERRLAEEAKLRNLTAMIRAEARTAMMEEFSLNKLVPNPAVVHHAAAPVQGK
jgi:hypothetical protein